MNKVRRPLSLLITILVSLPSLMAVARGDADPASAGLRFVVALSLIWTGFAILDHIVTGYVPAEDDGVSDEAALPTGG